MPENRRSSLVPESQHPGNPQKSPHLARRRSTVQFAQGPLLDRRQSNPAFNSRRRSSQFLLSRKPSKPIVLTEEQRKKIARDRFRKAVFKVKAMLRFGLPLRAKAAEEEEKPKAKVHYENTYQLGPDPAKTFKPSTAEKHMQEVLNEYLKTYKYNRFSAPNFSRALSTMMVDKMKELDFPRYKYVCNVIIGENKGQDFKLTSRCVWSDTTDSSASVSIQTTTFFATATIHAVYME